MPDLEDVYRKFGEVAETAQLLETELGNILLLNRGAQEGLLADPNPERAADLIGTINRNTLGQLIKGLNSTNETIVTLQSLLGEALEERNRLFHSFYRQHNFRRNSDEGRQLMLNDLSSIHATLLSAYKAVMLLSGIDLDAFANALDFPTRHVTI